MATVEEIRAKQRFEAMVEDYMGSDRSWGHYRRVRHALWSEFLDELQAAKVLSAAQVQQLLRGGTDET